MIKASANNIVVRLLLHSAVMLALASCAIQPAGKEEAEPKDEPVKLEAVIVDPAVQKSFDDAVALMKAERYDSAIPVFEQVVTQEKRLAAPFINLAISYVRTGDNKKARENLDQALKLDKANPVANNELGMMLRREGKFEEARKAYQAALGKEPEYLPAIMNLGILCDIYLRDWDCALEQFERYQDLKPDDKVKIWIADLERRAGG